MTESNHKILYQRAQVLNLLTRDLERVSGQLTSSRVVRFALRRVGEALQSDLVIQVDVRRADAAFDRPYKLALTPQGERLQAPAGDKSAPESATAELTGSRFLEICRSFLRRPIGPEESDMLLASVASEDRPVAVLCFRRPGRRFSRAETRFLEDAAGILSEHLTHRERERVQALKEKIYAKIIAELRPEDVLYRLLHGLKKLLQYDHGAAVLLISPDRSCLTVQAEIVGWTKAKSERVGQCLPFTSDLQTWLGQSRHPVLVRAGDPSLSSIPEMLRTPLLRSSPEVPPVRAMVIAVLHHRGRDLGILKIKSRSASTFTPGDLDILDQFLPLASVTLHNSTLYKMQHDLLMSVERRGALADLARAISHDLNNAFGVMLPLLQTLRRDVQGGAITHGQMARDLEVIEHYAGSSARIFQGLLSAAQGGEEAARWSHLVPILEGILRMLGPNLEGRKIQVVREFALDLPTVFLRRGEMEQLFLNLVYNARDAMPQGGVLTVRATASGGGVLAEVVDTGSGISDSIRGRIFEPFFTTKETGTGLGLDICRSIVWDYDGRLDLDSTPGSGTKVSVHLPRLAERLRFAAEEATAPQPPGEEVSP